MCTDYDMYNTIRFVFSTCLCLVYLLSTCLLCMYAVGLNYPYREYILVFFLVEGLGALDTFLLLLGVSQWGWWGTLCRVERGIVLLSIRFWFLNF